MSQHSGAFLVFVAVYSTWLVRWLNSFLITKSYFGKFPYRFLAIGSQFRKCYSLPKVLWMKSGFHGTNAFIM